MYVAEIREICGDYAIDIKHGVLNKEALTLYFNSRKNAEMVKYIIEVDCQKIEIDILIRKKKTLRDEIAELQAENASLKDALKDLQKEMSYMAMRGCD